MSDQEKLMSTMGLLKVLNSKLITICKNQLPEFIGFNIEKITAANETNVLHHGIDTLTVNILNQSTNLHQVLESWGHYIKSEGLSTKFVDRLPGIVVITKEVEQIKQIVNDINKTKDDIARIVRNNRDSYQRHKFIHDAFNYIMTEQVYRHVHYFEEEVTNVWFNWASRPVPKTYTIEEALQMLNEQRSRPKYMMTSNEWESMINAAIGDVQSGIYDYIQQIKEYKVLPTVELQYLDPLKGKIRKKINATTPLILLKQTQNTLPKYSILKSYTNKNKNKQVRLMPNKTLINAQLKLVGVISNK